MASSGFQPGESSGQEVNVPSAPRFMPPHIESVAGSIISGVGNFVKDAVTTTDNFFRNSLENEARNRVGVVNDTTNAMAQMMVNPEGVNKAIAEGTPIPDAISDGMTTASSLTTAKGMGKLNNTNYWAQMDRIARDLRSSYPGYKDYIDQTMYSLTERGPANSLHKALDTQLNMLNTQTQASQQHDWSLNMQLAERGASYNPDWDKLPLDQRIPLKQAALTQRNAYKIDEDATKLAIDREKLAGETASISTTQGMTRSLFDKFFLFKSNLDASTDPLSIEMRALVAEQKNVDSLTASGKMPSPERLMALQQSINQAKTHFYQQTVSPWQQQAIQAGMPEEKMNKAIESVMSTFDMYSTGIRKDLPNLTNTPEVMMKNWEDHNTFTYLHTTPNAPMINAAFKANGPNVANSLYNTPGVWEPLTASLLHRAMDGLSDNSYVSMDDALRTQMASLKPADKPRFVTQSVANFTTGWLSAGTGILGLPDSVVQQRTQQLYGNQNAAFYNGIDKSMWVDMYGTTVNSRTAGKLVEIHDKGLIDDKTYDDARTNMIGKGTDIIRSQLTDLNRTALYDDRYKIEWTDTNRIALVPAGSATSQTTRPLPEGSTLAERGVYAATKFADRLFAGPTDEQKINSQVDQVNSVIRNMESVIKATGGDPKVIIPKLIQQAGLNVGAAKEYGTNLTNTYAGILSAVATAKENEATRKQSEGDHASE